MTAKESLHHVLKRATLCPISFKLFYIVAMKQWLLIEKVDRNSYYSEVKDDSVPKLKACEVEEIKNIYRN